MVTYKMLGGGEITAESDKEVAERLRELSFNPGDNIFDFMQITSKNCYFYNSSIIRFSSKEAFVEDLKRHGFLK